MSFHQDSFHQYDKYDIHLDKKTYIKNNQFLWDSINFNKNNIIEILSRLKNIEKKMGIITPIGTRRVAKRDYKI